MRRFYFDYETPLMCPGIQAPPVVCMSYAVDDGPVDIFHARTGLTPGFPSLLGRDDVPLVAVLAAALGDDNTTMVAFNAAFEAVVTIANYPLLYKLLERKINLGLYQCCWIREKQIRVARGDGDVVPNINDVLKSWRIPLVLDKQCKWRLRYGELLNVPIQQWEQEAIDYSVGDIAVRELDIAQRHDAREVEYIDHVLQMNSAVDLALTTCWGFMTDLQPSEQLFNETEVRVAKAQEIILKHGPNCPPSCRHSHTDDCPDDCQLGYEHCPGSRPGLAEWEPKKGGEIGVTRKKKVAEVRMTQAFVAMGLDVPRKDPTETMLEKACDEAGYNYPRGEHIKKVVALMEEHGIPVPIGNIRMDAETCELSRDPVLEAYAEYGSADLLLDRVDRLRLAARAGKPLQASYDVLKETGRTSSRGGATPKPGEAFTAYGRNIQNLERAGQEEDA